MIKNLLNFVKIEHTLFSLPIVFSGAFLAEGLRGDKISAAKFIWIFAAVLGARSAGFAMNRIIDCDLDAKNPRTKDREMPSGAISPAAAWTFTACSAGLFILAASQLSKTCLMLAPIPLVFFFIYPYLKRYTMWAHLGLGTAWGIAPLGGWLAVNPQIAPFRTMMPAILLALFCIFWVAGFDVIYALLDEKSDRENHIFSMPAILGEKNALRVSEIAHTAAVLFLGTLVQVYLNHPLSFGLLTVAGALLIVSHWRVQFHPLTPPNIDFAFFKVNAALGFVVLLLVIL